MMISLGIMTMSKRSEQTYINEMAKRANQHDIKCYRFIPTDINPATQLISGEYFNPATLKWEACNFPLPSLLYDRCFYQEDFHSQQCKAIVSWMKTNHQSRFLGIGLPNKLELYKELRQTAISPYLPESEPFTSTKDFIKQLTTGKPLVLKPIDGSQGKGIYVIEKYDNHFLIKTDKQTNHIAHTLSLQAAANWLAKLTRKYRYLIQPYLYLQNECNQPFDLRIFMQKTEAGTWRELTRGMRTGSEGGIISNISAGGKFSPYEVWLQTIPANQQTFLSAELEEILAKLPAILDNKFPPLFEIGVDIGIESNGAIWILDINSKPGRKLVLETRPDLADDLYSAPFLYGKTLVSTDALEGR
ncbi:YheC/YheD family endospore coat-associated protein [Cytobacillus purgationiresistens]|uniref:Glutathione synthase/RimK-type ligase-like ATP-grasp enzyme n=1 Tax=Cytobacillus purgationiresistens TaxID=863449 RepID=A0ABU0AD44_9BACI|nr:YheC/YheD family protein [Cytobacillus purgationiresistens]MDQ0268965.1 glutathione synthase/RimK-type ligase-like ATP-grasp enzyme [Cytobacillus purgationiresistens]